MARKTLDAMAVLRSICALLMLVCILFFILPHAHDCSREDCPLCVLKNIFSEIFLAVCFSCVLTALVFYIGDFAYFLQYSAPQTLVHLKVKLSD